MLLEHHGYEYGDCADDAWISPNTAAVISNSIDRRIGVSRLPRPDPDLIELRRESIVAREPVGAADFAETKTAANRGGLKGGDRVWPPATCATHVAQPRLRMDHNLAPVSVLEGPAKGVRAMATRWKPRFASQPGKSTWRAC
jgi:hypothetical protein